MGKKWTMLELRGGTRPEFPAKDLKDKTVHWKFGSDNDLKTQIGKCPWEGSCQVSSLVWCYYALAGYEGEDPRQHNEKALKGLVKRMMAMGFELGKRNEKQIKTMIGWLDLDGEVLRGKKKGWRGTEETFENLIKGERDVCLIWMHSHMVAFYKKGNNELYWYDNAVGLVLCQNKVSLETWVRWTCDCNREASLGEGEWTYIRWKKKQLGNMDLKTVKQKVDKAAQLDS